MIGSALYFGTVAHRRTRPRVHHLRYRVFSILFDLDELPALDRSLRLFSRNKFNLYSFHDRDHGDGGGDVRAWIDAQLATAGIEAGGPVRLLCYPRVLGYVFNPLSVFYCYANDGRLAAILYEVNNTFGDRHSYLFAVPPDAGATVRHGCAKEMHVSPFLPMNLTYRFRALAPGDTVAIGIETSDTEGPILGASFGAQRIELTNGNLARAFLLYPLLTLKVVGGIHWEALRLWVKGAHFHRRPQPPAQSLTIVRQDAASEVHHADA